MLPHAALLKSCRHPAALEALLALADQALRTWEPHWSGFLAAEVREEAEAVLGGLSELRLSSDGGYPGAERRRLKLERAEAAETPESGAELAGLEIAGNFLFDPAEADDIRQALQAVGAEADDLGDAWIRGDRGGQAIASAALARRLDGGEALVRTVPVRLEARPIAALQLPAARTPRRLSSVEASRRIDAVASAGFGLSRSRMAALIRQGAVRIDWQPVSSPSRELAVGERVQLQGRGELEILSIEPTKRERLRIVMERR
jgi:photosystem II S4 domain protein